MLLRLSSPYLPYLAYPNIPPLPSLLPFFLNKTPSPSLPFYLLQISQLRRIEGGRGGWCRGEDRVGCGGLEIMEEGEEEGEEEAGSFFFFVIVVEM